MPKPIPGSSYTVVDGDSLSLIAAKAYGDPSRWPEINQANIKIFKNDDPNIIFPGEVLFIPEDATRENLKSIQRARATALGSIDDNSLTLTINGVKIPVLTANILITMDTLSDTFTASFAWNPGKDIRIDNAIKPYRYPVTTVHLGKKLIFTGIIYNPQKKLSNRGRIVTVTGYSKIADFIDSSLKPPYSIENVTLQQRATSLLAPYGVLLQYELGTDSQYKRVTAESTETGASHLLKLVSQRGALITSTPEGNLKIYKSSNSGPTMGTLDEENSIVLDWSGSWDGRKRFASYKAISQSPLNNGSFAVASDVNVSRPRSITFKANDTSDGDAQQAAFWKRSKTLANALSQKLPLRGWYAPNGQLLEVNKFITVSSPTLQIKGYNFLIKNIEYVYGNNILSNINIVPPQVFNGKDIVDPWQ